MEIECIHAMMRHDPQGNSNRRVTLSISQISQRRMGESPRHAFHFSEFIRKYPLLFQGRYFVGTMLFDAILRF
jgi:hypothetical protein